MATEVNAQSVSEEIATAIATIWTRHAAKRPHDLQVELGGNRVSCVIPGAVQDFEIGPEKEGSGDPEGRQVTYRREAAAAVARTTGRHVSAVISDRNADTDAATDIFILDPAAKAEFGSAGWIAR